MSDETIRIEKVPPVDNVYARTGLYRVRIEPHDVSLYPGEHFPCATYGVLVSWEKGMGAWLKVVASGVDNAAFKFSPDDLRLALEQHATLDSQFGRNVLEETWGEVWGFLVGTTSQASPTRIECLINTNHARFIRYASDPTNFTPEMDGLLIHLRVNFFAATHLDRMRLQLVLRPDQSTDLSRQYSLGMGVPRDKCLAAVDLGNTNTAMAVLDPVQRETRQIALLLEAESKEAGVLPLTGSDADPIPSDVRLDMVRTWLPLGGTVPPTRRFPDYETFPDDDNGNAVDCVIGKRAQFGKVNARSLVLGSKRMAAARGNGTIPVFAAHRSIYDDRDEKPTMTQSAMFDIDTRMPLELLACNVLRYYREARKRWPGTLAMTYPTTFSRTELQHIRRALQGGWLRMQERRRLEENESLEGVDRDMDAVCKALRKVVNGKQDLATQTEDPLVRLVLDEASAAAFFYIYRRIFEKVDERGQRKTYRSATGGLVAFQSQFPTGLNMLLYDCGGGTTDIAIVSARVLEDWQTLRVKVEARSGVRDFGGDDITTQVAKLLKAKFCGVLAEGQSHIAAPEAKWPAIDKEREAYGELLGSYIEETRQKDPLDSLVPTRDLGNPQEERRAAALTLWKFAEELKVELGRAEGTNPEVKLSGLKETEGTLGAILLKGKTDRQQRTNILKKLQQISISRGEIDALIYRKVRWSVNNCNALIKRVVEGGTSSEPSEIHWVVASGGAVKYPLVEQMLRTRLNVAFLEDDEDDPRHPTEPRGRGRGRDAAVEPGGQDSTKDVRRAVLKAKLREPRFLFDENDAKNATSKGAVLALAVMENPGQQFDVLFDSDLADRLPFDVGYFSGAKGDYEPLFAEHTHYRELQAREPDKIPLGEIRREKEGRQFVLSRKFPGDEKYSDYIIFNFDKPIQGPHLEVFYDDMASHEFRVVDGKENEGKPIDPSAGDIHRSPAQRGDI